MFKTLFGLDRRANRAIVDGLYDQIVAAARQQEFYAHWGVPDTPLGRYEMLALHVFLFLERARGTGAALGEVAQELTDEFFKDVEHSLRELGIGDLGVPKRMKKLAKMFYGRAEAYRAAVEAGDASALSAALARNVQPDAQGWKGARPLADYALAASLALARQPEEQIASGRISFPDAAAVQGDAQ
jgi:cytochrome b pre-mRNA-processing protein 3